MTKKYCDSFAALTFAFVFVFWGVGTTNAQWNAPNAYGYSTGYGTVYGSYGLASTMQSMYNVAKAQTQKTTERNAMIKKWGLAAVQKAEREAVSGASTPSNPKIIVPPPPVAKNHGVFRPVSTVDTGTAMAIALADTSEERALIKQIYTKTKTSYEKQAALKGWKNNISGGLTFFTVTAMVVYHDAEEPDNDALDAYYKVLNAAIDDIPGFASVSNKDKQNFNNMMIGFGGLLLAGYIDGKQTDNAETLANYRKLAGMLIEMVLKTSPDNIRVEDGQIVMK